MKLTAALLILTLTAHASSHERAQRFFLDHYEAAEQIYFCDGIPIQLSLGVWALESGYGTSTAAQRNNLAGIASYKGGKHWKRFKTKAEFYRAFAAIFQRPCYRNDLQPKSVDEYLEAMEWGCCSYHRSREYTHKIKWIIKRYKLDEMAKYNEEKLSIIYDKRQKDFIVKYPRRCDGNLALTHLVGNILKYKIPIAGVEYPYNFDKTNFIEELEKRGYDPKTLKFSIELKK